MRSPQRPRYVMEIRLIPDDAFTLLQRGVGTAFIVSISNTVSMYVLKNEIVHSDSFCNSASPQIYFDSDDNFRKGHAISAA